jgi:hypothetical protein
MTGTVDEWQAWTGMVFPATGDVIAGGLSTVRIDEENDRGTCTEPMTSRLAAGRSRPLSCARKADAQAMPGSPLGAAMT